MRRFLYVLICTALLAGFVWGLKSLSRFGGQDFTIGMGVGFLIFGVLAWGAGLFRGVE